MRFCFAAQSDCDFFYQIILSFGNPKRSRSWTSWPHYNQPPLKIRPSSNNFTFIYKSRLHPKVQILWEDHKIWKIRSPFYKLIKGQLISKCLFLVSSILPKNDRKQFDLRYNSSKVEFFHSFFGSIEDTKKTFLN